MTRPLAATNGKSAHAYRGSKSKKGVTNTDNAIVVEQHDALLGLMSGGRICDGGSDPCRLTISREKLP